MRVPAEKFRTGRGLAAPEVALALVTAVLFSIGTARADHFADPGHHIDAFGVALVVLACLALAVRQRWPLVTLAVVTAAAVTYFLSGYTFGPILFAFFIAVYSVARWLPFQVALPSTLVASGLLVSPFFIGETGAAGWTGVALGSAWAVVPLAVGVAVQTWRESLRRERLEQVRKHVDDERLRVSRDVHDVVGHGLAAINMQAKVALRSVHKNPSRVEEALEAISASSGAALEELRMVLARLDERASPAPLRPSPTLADVSDLADRLEQTGMKVHVISRGDPRPLPGPVDLAGYRVVQEALTNALRHGTGDRAEVAIAYSGQTITVTVTNPVSPDGTRGDHSGSGLGIRGMRDRVEAVRGTLEVESERARFVVRAILPIGEDR